MALNTIYDVLRAFVPYCAGGNQATADQMTAVINGWEAEVQAAAGNAADDETEGKHTR